MIPGLTSICFPTTGRRDRALACLSRLLETTAGERIEVLVMVDNGDLSSARAIADWLRATGTPGHVWYTKREATAIALWNLLAARSRGETLVLAADDLAWGDGWLDAAKAALSALPGGWGLVGLNDGNRDGATNFPTHWLVSRRCCVETLGGVLISPCYRGLYADMDVTAIARRAGRYAWARDANVRHDHPGFYSREPDATDRLREQWQVRDMATYQLRKMQQFPVDWQPVIGAASLEPE